MESRRPEQPENRALQIPWEIISLIICLYFFILGVKLFGTGFKSMGAEWANPLIKGASNPLTGLFIGILATALMQSSSATTSMLVGLVAAGQISLPVAIPVVMGANIGTTATNTFVSVAHITRKGEFRRAMAASSVHDFFNLLTVCILLPLECYTHLLQKAAQRLSGLFGGLWTGKVASSPLDRILKPVVHAVKRGLEPVKAHSPKLAAILIILVGGAMIFLALMFLTRIMKSLMMRRVESTVVGHLKAGGYAAMLVGLVVTVLVQSSSITTSLMVPLAASGIITLAQVYPVTLGANIGTTMTAIIAALAGNQAALTLAFTHMFFNVSGVLIFYVPPPLRKIPLALANKMGDCARNHRGGVLLYIVVLFYLVPAIAIWIGWKG